MTKAPENAPALLFFGGDYNEDFFGGLRRRNNELNELTNFVGRQHCSSLCLQSEGHGHVARRLKFAIRSL